MLSAFYTKNMYERVQHITHKDAELLFVTIKGGKMQADKDFKINYIGHRAEITDIETGEVVLLNVRDPELEYGSILKMKINNEDYTTQFLGAKDTLYFDFYFKGHPVRTIVYDDR